MASSQLTPVELAALDVVIAAMRSNVGDDAPGGFIGGIINATRKIIDATRVVIPVVQAVTKAVGAGGPSDQAAILKDVISQLPPGVTLEQLIQFRESIK